MVSKELSNVVSMAAHKKGPSGGEGGGLKDNLNSQDKEMNW